MKSINQYQLEMKGLEKTSKKLKGKAAVKAKRRLSRIKRRLSKLKGRNAKANQMAKDTTKRLNRATKKAAPEIKRVLKNIDKSKKKQAFNKDQGFIPGFLKQMNMVRVEELVADKLFAAIKTGEVTFRSNQTKKAVGQ